METLLTPFKKLPLLLPALAWICGLIAGQSAFLQLYVLVVPLLFYGVFKKTWLLFLCAGLAFGMGTHAWQQHRLAVDDTWLAHKVQIEATIQDVRHTAQYIKLRLSDVLRDDGQTLSGKVDAYVYHHKQPQALKPDMRIQATLKLHRPRNKQNPAYFDYEQYTFDQGVVLIGSVSGDVRIIASDISWLETMRQRIRQALRGMEQNQQGILLALLLADRSQVPLVIHDAFAASGAMHLLAISGLHMGLVAAWGFVFAWWLMTRREAWIVRFPVRLVALSSGVGFAMIYATLAGWPIPAQRAFLMLLAGVLAWVLRAKQVPLNTMFAALLLITLFDPASVRSVSLWLSFVATSALLVWAGRHNSAGSMYAQIRIWFQGVLWVSIIASLATLPLIGFVFERLPVWGLLANVLLVPLYAFWVLPLALLGEFLAVFGFSGLATSVFSLSGQGIALGNDLLLALYALPWGKLWLRGDMPWMFAVLGFALLVAGMLWLYQQRKISMSILLVALGVYAVVLTSEHHPKQASFYAWDVGQGASSWLSLPDFQLLVDMPGKAGSRFNGGSIAAQNMRKLGVLHADAVVLSHAQSDHAGGFERLLANLNHMGELWLADVPRNHVYFQAILESLPVRWLKQGDSFHVRGAKVQVLWPPKGYAPRNSNHASLVLLLTLDSGQRILLPGDMELPVEKQIIRAGLQDVDVMLMPHHGSKTSSSKVFVEQVRPSIVIAQTGYNNHYGFPKDEVVQRYKNVGSQVLNTADGYVHISFSERGIKLEQSSNRREN